MKFTISIYFFGLAEPLWFGTSELLLASEMRLPSSLDSDCSDDKSSSFSRLILLEAFSWLYPLILCSSSFRSLTISSSFFFCSSYLLSLFLAFLLSFLESPASTALSAAYLPRLLLLSTFDAF